MSGRERGPFAAGAARGRGVRRALRGLVLGALAGLLGVAWSSGPGSAQAGASGPVAHASDAQGWSAPAELAACRRVTAPRIAFPSEGPSTPSGAGAVVWASPLGSCVAATGPLAAWELSVAAIGAGDALAPAHTQPLGASGAPALSAVGAGLGRVTVLASARDRGPAAVGTLVLQGPASAASWLRLATGSRSRPALARAYLGDVAIATVRSGPRLAVRLQRYNARGWGPSRSIPLSPGPITALTATMDYRADVLLAWQQNGAIWAHMLRISGRPDPTQRLGPSGPDPQLQAVVSDNDHGMVAWSTAGPGASTHVYLSLSSAGVRFGPPRVLASFADPQRIALRPGSLQLQRLSTENVMLAWTVAEHGSYEVRAAAAVFAASRPSTLLTPGSQAVLAGLAPGGAHEAIAVWSAAPNPTGLSSPDTELWAARLYIRRSHVVLEAPQRIAAAGPNVAPAVAVDPADDRPVAAWLRPGALTRIEYALGPARSGYRPRPPLVAVRPTAGTHWLRIGAVALAALAALGLLVAWRATRRRRLRQP